MAKEIKKKKSIWSKLTGVEDEEITNAEGMENKNTNSKKNFSKNPDPEEDAEEIEETEEEVAEEANKEGWAEGDENYEGQLSVDVYQTADSIVIKSTIAGVKPEDVDVAIENDMLTIRGQRKVDEEIAEENYFYQECYWGGFSRSIILPVEVVTDEIDASLRDGVLTVTLPKAKKAKGISIKVKREE